MKKKVKSPEKSFQNVCKDLHTVFGFLLILNVIAAVFVAIGSIGGFIDGTLIFWDYILMYMSSAIMITVFNYLRLIFKELKTSETPFCMEASRRIRAVAQTFVIGGGVYWISSIILHGLQYMNALSTNREEVPMDATGILYIIVGSIIWGIAYIFNYGSKLQQESDETI